METPERYQRATELFHDALALHSDQRARFLAEACVDDDELLAAVNSLLTAHERAKGFTGRLAAGIESFIIARERTGDQDEFSTEAATLVASPADFTLSEFASAPGHSIAHYKILSPLGKGGMGEVYLAEDQKLGRKVAIKFLPAELTHDEDRVRRFIQEAKAASALNHPNIVTIYELGEDEVGRFIAMEYISGQTSRAVSKQSLSMPMLERIAGQIAKALGVAHAAGIIHRDIKPENIMVRADGYVKVLDFGLARLAPDSAAYSPSASPNATNPGMIMGTLSYLSPEQARGEVVTSATDVFAFGIVLYELATGRHPFHSKAPIGFLNAIASQTPLPPSRLNP